MSVGRPVRDEGRLRRGLRRAGIGVCVAAIAALAAASFAEYRSEEMVDDAWITFRYARNLANGDGFVYNRGERVQGTSTPLYTLLLAGLARAGADIPPASVAVGFVSFLATALMVFLFVYRLHSAAFPGLAGAIMLIFSPFLLMAPNGMETMTYCALILLSVYLAHRDRYYAGFAVAGLAMLTRLDGVLVIVALCFPYWLRYRRLPARELIAPAALNGAWLAFAFAYFGHPMPQAVLAKRYHDSTGFLSLDLLYAVEGLPTLYLFLASFGALHIVFTRSERRSGMPALLIWGASYVLVCTASGMPLYLWYFAPVYLAVALLAGHGLAALMEHVAHENRHLMVAAVGAFILALYPAARPWHYQIFRADAMYCSNLDRARYEGARYTASYVRKGSTIASVGIGMVGWTTDAYIIDCAGLVSPQTVAAYPRPYFRNALAAVVERYQPDYVFDAVPPEVGWPENVTREYRVVRAFRHGSSGLTEFVLWERKVPEPAH